MEFPFHELIYVYSGSMICICPTLLMSGVIFFACLFVIILQMPEVLFDSYLSLICVAIEANPACGDYAKSR